MPFPETPQGQITMPPMEIQAGPEAPQGGSGPSAPSDEGDLLKSMPPDTEADLLNAVTPDLPTPITKNFRKQPDGTIERKNGEKWEKLNKNEQESYENLAGALRLVGPTAGGLAGAELGAAAGTALAPGPGTAIGGALGAMAGSVAGGDLYDPLVNLAVELGNIKGKFKRRDMTDRIAEAFFALVGETAIPTLAARGGAGAASLIGKAATPEEQLAQAASKVDASNQAAVASRKELGTSTGVPLAPYQTNLENPAMQRLAQETAQGKFGANEAVKLQAFHEQMVQDAAAKVKSLVETNYPKMTPEEAKNFSMRQYLTDMIRQHSENLKVENTVAAEAARSRQFDISSVTNAIEALIERRLSVARRKDGSIDYRAVPDDYKSLLSELIRVRNMATRPVSEEGLGATGGHAPEVTAIPPNNVRSSVSQVQPALGMKGPPTQVLRPTGMPGEFEIASQPGPPVANPMSASQPQIQQGLPFTATSTPAPSHALMPPNQAGKASRGLTLGELRTTLKNLQELADFRGQKRSYAETDAGFLAHEVRKRMDEITAEVLDPIDANAAQRVRQAKDFYSKHIESMQEVQRAVESNPTAFARVVLRDPDTAEKLWSFLPEKDKPMVAGKFLDELVDNRIRRDIAENKFVFDAESIKKDWDAIDPKVKGIVFGEKVSKSLDDLWNVGRILQKSDVRGPIRDYAPMKSFLGKVAEIQFVLGYGHINPVASGKYVSSIISSIAKKNPKAADFIRQDIEAGQPLGKLFMRSADAVKGALAGAKAAAKAKPSVITTPALKAGFDAFRGGE